MNALENISKRRSTRNFVKNIPVDDEIIRKMIFYGMNAPSAKNRQPWKFLVLKDTGKLTGLLYQKHEEIKDSKDPGSLYRTIKCIESASHIILIFNNQLSAYYHDREFRRHRWLADVQSIGACIQNMLLAGEELGVGSLWICDVFYADKEICDMFNRCDELIAAVAVGIKGNTNCPKKYLVEFEQAVEWVE
ncbi:MAG: nitroreductase family protein [Anaerocolumna sp.]